MFPSQPGLGHFARGMLFVLWHSGNPEQAKKYPKRPSFFTMGRPHFSHFSSVASSREPLRLSWVSITSSTRFLNGPKKSAIIPFQTRTFCSTLSRSFSTSEVNFSLITSGNDSTRILHIIFPSCVGTSCLLLLVT